MLFKTSKKAILLAVVFFIIFCIVYLVIKRPIFVNLDQNKKGIIRQTYPNYNLIIISLGNVGARHMSLYGYKRKTTPLIDEWAKDAIVFENFFSPASWTLPVATSLFTSLQPYSHNVLHRRYDSILDERIRTLPEILRDTGYKTASFTGGLDYAHSWGSMRGFDEFGDNPPFTSLEVSTEQAKAWLDDNSNEKFFLFIHGYDAHCPFMPPDEFKRTFSNPEGKNITVDTSLCLRGYENTEDGTSVAYYFKSLEGRKAILSSDDIDYLEDLYDEEVLYEDYLVGNFLKSMDKKVLNNSIVIILAEHGEMFAKHGRFGRAGTIRGTLYDEVVNIPLIIKFPKGASKRVKGLAQVIDIMPTVLRILGIAPPSYVQGKDLLSLLDDKSRINKYVFAGTRYWLNPYYGFISMNESIRDEEWKLIHESRGRLKGFEGIKNRNLPFFGQVTNEGKKKAFEKFRERKWVEEANTEYKDTHEEEIYELYNIKNDPDELNNLADKETVVFQKLKEELATWVNKTKEYDIENVSADLFSPESMENIKKHGYW